MNVLNLVFVSICSICVYLQYFKAFVVFVHVCVCIGLPMPFTMACLSVEVWFLLGIYSLLLLWALEIKVGLAWKMLSPSGLSLQLYYTIVVVNIDYIGFFFDYASLPFRNPVVLCILILQCETCITPLMLYDLICLSWILFSGVVGRVFTVALAGSSSSLQFTKR